MRVILASASPRRQELLGRLFEEFEVIPATGEESSEEGLPEQIVRELSWNKADEVRQRLFQKERAAEDVLIIGADTIVVFQGEVLGKPKEEEDAARMLRMLSGSDHQVYTGVTLLRSRSGAWEEDCFYELTQVSFYPMSEEEIAGYIRTGEPMDKAGGYGIQGMGARFVRQIQGDYHNVVGLPLAKIYQMIK